MRDELVNRYGKYIYTLIELKKLERKLCTRDYLVKHHLINPLATVF